MSESSETPPSSTEPKSEKERIRSVVGGILESYASLGEKIAELQRLREEQP